MKWLIGLFFITGALEAAVFQSKIRHIHRPKNLIPRTPSNRNKMVSSEPLHEYDTASYSVDVSIGTPAQAFRLILAVEGGGVWVVGRNCTSAYCNGLPESGYTKNHYDERKSSTYKDHGEDFDWHYGAGSVAGRMVEDVVQFAGLTTKNFYFADASEIPEYWGYEKVDGLLGLGLPTFVLQTVADQLDQPVFTIFLKDEEYADGALTFGGPDSVHCDSTVRWLPVAKDKVWQFTISGFSMGSYTVRKDQVVMAILDDLYMFGKNEYVTKMAQLAGAKYTVGRGYTVPCSAQSTAPDIVWNIGGMGYILPASEYIEDLGFGDGQCAFMIAIDDNIDAMGIEWSFNSRFMRKFCMSYDFGNKKVGFARAK